MRCSRSPKACGWLVAYSMNSIPSIPSGLDGSGMRSRLVIRTVSSATQCCRVSSLDASIWPEEGGGMTRVVDAFCRLAEILIAAFLAVMVLMAFVYGTGVVFAVFAAVLLLRDLWHILTGQLSEDDLVMLKGTEEKP